MNDIVSEAIAELRPPPTIVIEVADKLPVIESKDGCIKQIFRNLLENAVKFMDKPRGRVKIGCVEDNGFWKFSVADNGPGIEKRHLDRIFDVFQTLLPHDEFESTGIGLSIVKKIVEINDGRIWVESKPGQGSTFFFTWPRLKKDAANEERKADTVCAGR